ncbi:hypothetical protein ACFYWP_34770, partial [Actinacidiphila glaucinigra]|uniref:hypothetical protein n=1 Tax=Actinacidiphila glaucinigra TaxID=235986 RepID=UPI0036752BFE
MGQFGLHAVTQVQCPLAGIGRSAPRQPKVLEGQRVHDLVIWPGRLDSPDDVPDPLQRDGRAAEQYSIDGKEMASPADSGDGSGLRSNSTISCGGHS